MSALLLQHTILKRSTCSLSHRLHACRAYVSQATALHAVVDYSESEASGRDVSNSSEAGSSSTTRRLRSKTHEKSKDLHRGSKPKDQSNNKKTDKTLAPFKDPFAPTETDIYLDAIDKSSREPSLQDIERYRPERHAQNVDSLQYSEEYNALVDKLCRSFSRQQLRGFAVLYGLDSRSIKTKIDYAESIIEKQWHWPSLKEVQKQQRDRTEVSVKSFPVNPAQLFLLLGKDGAELLQLSKDYNVHIGLTRNPLNLRVEGLRGSLKALSSHIAAIKNAIVEETFVMPGEKPLKQELVQPISRLADAYVDTKMSKGTVRICAKHKRNLALAKRLIIRATMESEESSRTPLLSYLPAGVQSSTPLPAALFPHTYSVYPFLSPRSLPWTMKTGGAFRIRRVVEWLGVGGHEDVQETGGLAGGRGRLLSVAMKELDLKDTLFGELPMPSNSGTPTTLRVVTASFGHVLVPSSTSAQRASIVPPLKGFYPISRILKWLEKSSMDTTFVPSLPIKLLNSAPEEQRFLVRLLYHAFSESPPLRNKDRQFSRSQPTKMIKFEIVLAQPRPTPSTTDGSNGPVHLQGSIDDVLQEESLQAAPNEISTAREQDPGPYEVDEFVESLLKPDGSLKSSGKGESMGITSESDIVSPTNTQTAEPRCWAGVGTTTNVILPDRPMDMRFSAFDCSALVGDQEPEELQYYSSALQTYLKGGDNARPAAPSPPNNISYEGEIYVLHKSSSVRQGTEVMRGASIDHQHTQSSQNLSTIVSESVLDLESQQKSTACEISCTNHTSDENWSKFLSDCDRLTSAIYHSSGREGSKEGSKDTGLDID